MRARSGRERTQAENLAAQRRRYERDIFLRDVRRGHRYALLIATATNATYSHPICSPSLRKGCGLQHPSAAIAIAAFCGWVIQLPTM
jgi:fatty acid desaturase